MPAKPQGRRSTPSNEMFYMENGRRSDAALHAQLLDDVEFAEDVQATRERLLSEGMEPEFLDRFFGVQNSRPKQG